MSLDDNSSDTTSSSNDERQQQDTTTSLEAAGIIQGLGQSIKGSMIRLPGVKNLPHQHSILRKFRSMIQFPGVGRLPHQHAVFLSKR